MSVQSTTSSVPRLVLQADLPPEGDPVYVPPDPLESGGEMTEIAYKINRAGEEIGKISKHAWMKDSDPEHAETMKRISKTLDNLIRLDFDLRAIATIIDREIETHRTKMAARYNYSSQRAEDARTSACFGQRLRCMDFPKRPPKTGQASPVAVATTHSADSDAWPQGEREAWFAQPLARSDFSHERRGPSQSVPSGRDGRALVQSVIYP
jgi:hypothetical protein